MLKYFKNEHSKNEKRGIEGMISIEYIHKLLDVYNQLCQTFMPADRHPADIPGYPDVPEKQSAV